MTHNDLTGRMIGELVIVERLGEGGHGVIYRAYQPALARDVVVKVLHAQRRDNPIAQERFLREAQLASQLDHPYAAHVYAFGIEADGLRWIAMELVHGVTLEEWLATHGPMSLDQLVPFIEHVAQVVHAAHQHGIVHRDLKPSNMMVIELSDNLFPKLLDFGIAKAPPALATSATIDDCVSPPRTDGSATATGSEDFTPVGLTRPGTRIGSWPYTAPEQWHTAAAVNAAADIYALGMIVYRALSTGELFAREPAMVSPAEYPQLPQLGGELAAVDHVIQRALARDPAARHATALELAADLRAVLRASEREQIRSAAQQWHDRRHSPGLLWGREELPDLQRWSRSAPGVLSPLECSFVAASQRRARRAIWIRRALGVAALALMVAGLQYRSIARARIAEAAASQAELEQGRSALLHNEPDAAAHLSAAYRHDPSPSTAFMLARAVQPRLAELARLPAVKGRMWSASFSPDGRRIVTTDDAAAQVWDAQSYRLLFTLSHGDTVYQASYSADGKTIVTAGGDSAVRLWDAQTGTLLRTLTSRDTPVHYGAVAISGKRIAAIDLTGEITHIWDASDGSRLAELHNQGTGFYSVAFSPDARFLATGGGNDVLVFDTQTWTNVKTVPGPGIRSLSWAPDGARLLTGSTLGQAALWQIPSGKPLWLHDVGETITAVAFSPDGSLAATANRTGSQQIWAAASGALQSKSNPLHDKIFSIEFDATSKRVVTASASGSVAATEIAQPMPSTILDAQRSVVLAAHFAPDGKRIVSVSGESAWIWDAAALYRRWTTAPISDRCGYISSLEPDRRFVAVGCQDHKTTIWDTDRDKLLAELPPVTPVDHNFSFANPAVSSMGDRAAIAHNNDVQIYELPGGRLLRTITHPAAVTALAFATGRHDLVSGAIDGSILVTTDSGAQLSIPTAATAGGIDAVALLPDGQVLAADAKQRLRAYDSHGITLATLTTQARAQMFRISADGRELATVPSVMDKKASLEIWDLEHYQRLSTLSNMNDEARVFSARFIANHDLLAAYSDGVIRRWNTTAGQLLQIYPGSTGFLTDATLSPDNSMVIASGGDGALHFWDAQSGRALWTLPAHPSSIVGLRVDGDDIVTRSMAGEIARWHVPAPLSIFTACSHAHCEVIPR